MYSTTSSTWVQLASLLSRTPSDAEIDRPLAQRPSKPASAAMRAERPLWASIMKSSFRGSSMARRRAVRLASVLGIGVLRFVQDGKILFDLRDEVVEVG